MKMDEIRERLQGGEPLSQSRAAPVHFWAIPCPDDIAVADMGDLIEQDLRERFRVQHLFVRTWLADNGDGTSGVCARVYDHCPPAPDDYDVWAEPPEGHLATLLVDEQPEGSLRYGVEVGSFQAVRALFVPARPR